MKQTVWGRQAGGQSHSCSNLWSSRGGYCWLCAENIASTWEYHRPGLWAGQLWGEITTTPISISVPIMCHRESYGQWIGPRANTERPLSALYHLRTIVTWPGFGHQSQEQDAGARRPPGALWPPVGGDWGPSPCYSPGPALTSYWRYGQLFTLAIIDTRDFGQRSDFVKSDRIKMAIVLAALL